MKTPRCHLLIGLASLAVLGGLALPARACDACAVYLAEGAGRPGVTLAVAQQFTHLGTVWDGAGRVHDPARQFLDGATTQVALLYGRGGWWSVQASLPYLDRSYRRSGHEGIERGHLAGWGDATLSARGELWRAETRAGSFAFAALGGLKFATGAAGRLGAELDEDHALEMPGMMPPAHAGAVHDHDLALGSGSTDYLFGADAGWHRGRLFARAGAQYKLRRPGAFGYRFADETVWELAPGGYLRLSERGSVALQAVFSAEHKNLDTLGGAAQADTGFSTRFLGGRITATAGAHLHAEATLELPVRRRTSGLTVAPDYRLRAAATWRF